MFGLPEPVDEDPPPAWVRQRLGLPVRDAAGGGAAARFNFLSSFKWEPRKVCRASRLTGVLCGWVGCVIQCHRY